MCRCGCGQPCACGYDEATHRRLKDQGGDMLAKSHPHPGRVQCAKLTGEDAHSCALPLGHFGRCL